jgi:hypothetical protein
MGQEVRFGDDHDLGGPEHVGVFQLVIAFGDREHDDLGALAEIEQRRAYEVTDILDHCHRFSRWFQCGEAASQHLGVEVATRSGIDLNRTASGAADAGGIGLRCLVAFDDTDGERAAEITDRPLEQGRLAGSGRTHQVQSQDAAAGEPAPVALGKQIILGEDLLLQCDDRAVVVMVMMIMIMMMVVMVMMIVAVVMRMAGFYH